MVFRRILKKTDRPCSKCGKINEEGISEVFIIEIPAFSTTFRICELCQVIPDLETEITIDNRINVKLGLR